MNERTSTKQTRNANVRNARGRSSSRIGLLISLVVIAVVTILLLTERIDVLYILATLSIAALLITVGFSSFGESREATEPVPFDDAAAIADRTAPVAPALSGEPVKRAGKRA